MLRIVEIRITGIVINEWVKYEAISDGEMGGSTSLENFSEKPNPDEIWYLILDNKSIVKGIAKKIR